MGLTKPRAAQIFNLDYKQSTRVVTTTNITLTGGAPNLVDGVTLSLGDRVLVTGQSTGSQNGLYQVTTLGSGANGTWARTSDGNENGEIEAGMIVMVTEGTIYADTQWKLITDDPIVIGTTALTFTQNYMANSISGGTSNVVVNSNANVTVSAAGTANVLTISNTGAFVSGVVSATGNVTGNYILGNGSLLTGVITSSANINNGTSNVTVVSSGGNVTVGIAGTGNVAVFANTGLFVTGVVSATGNVTGGNVLTAGIMSSTGNLQAGNLRTAGLISATGNLQAGNLLTAGVISATGNLQAGNLLTAGVISATGNGVIAGRNLLVGAAYTTFSVAGRGIVAINGTTDQMLEFANGVTNYGYLYHSGSNMSLFNNRAGFIDFNATNGNINFITSSFQRVQIDSTGIVSVTGNVQAGNLRTAGSITAAGNIQGSNLRTAGLITASGTIGSAANIIGGNLTTAGLITATGNVIGGNIRTAGLISATGTITSAGNLSLTGNIVDIGEMWINTSANGNINLNPNGTGQVNIPAGILSVTGNIQGGNLITTGLITATGNITGGNILTVGQVSATGNVSGNFFIGNGAFLTGLSAGTSNGISNGATAISIPVASGNIAMSVAGQSNTVVINLGSFTMYGTFAGPKTLAANVTVADSVNALLLGPVTIDDGYNITVPSNSALSTYGDASPDIVGSSVVVSGNITGGNLLTAGLISATGNVTGFNILTTGLISATGNITGGNITTAGNITGNNIFTSGNILPTANATSNIGNSSFQYNTIFAKATSAQYADLAENYEADDTYEPGTVLCFGGSKEVTVCNVEDCSRVAGVVSTNPSYLMNSGQTGAHVASLALQGRVPTKVTGQVRKGDLMVSAGNGQAKTNNEARAGTIIGKALANSEGDTVIEVVVGRD